jgi:hypothetical protein
MKYVIAGSKNEYDTFIREYKLNPNEYKYVYDAISIRGTRDPHGFLIGSWRNRDDISEIVETIWLCMRTPNKEFDKILAEFRSHKREVY